MNSNCILLIILLGVPLLVSSQICEHMEIIPHPQWCSAFFLCRFGFWTVVVCPNELMFNHYTRRCDFPENVDCINDPDLTTPEWSSPELPSSSTPSETTYSTTSDTTYSTPSDTTYSTPSDTSYSTPIDTTFSTSGVPTFSTPTVPPWHTPTTPERPTAPSFTTPTRPSIPTRSHERSEVISKISCNDATQPSTLSHPICQYFYKCINGIAIQMKCADGSVWNSKREICDYPENVVCTLQ